MAIRVLLADDEPLIVKGLRKMIAGEKQGVEIVGHAYDGDELADKIATLSPDIIISDISMPRRTGLDVLRMIHERQLPVKVIFISAYQEFHYAKEAVSLGAVEYLIKPIEREQLEAALEKAIALIEKADEAVRSRDKLKQLERQRKTEELQEELSRLAEGTMTERSDAFRGLEAQFRAPFFTALAVAIERLQGNAGRWTEQERRLVEFAVDNMLDELIVVTGIGHYFAVKDCRMLVIAHSEAGKPYETAKDLKSKLNGYLKLDVSIGVGQPVRDLGRLAETCRQAEQALAAKYFEGLDKVLPFVHNRPAASAENELYQYRSDIARSLGERNLKSAQEALDRLLQAIRRAAEGNKQLAVATAFSSMLAVVQEIQKSGVALADGSFDIQGLQARLGDYDTFEGMADGIRAMLGDLYESIDNRSGNRDKLLLARVTDYIEEHYAEEITLESVSAVAYMNPYYFSAFFKKHMKENFKPYVTDVRMRHAAKLLASTDLMMYEVAEKIGYGNARHFSDVFKKKYGVLPHEYRQSRRGKT